MIQAGDTIGPYTLIRTLGRGAFGEVWLADRASSLLTTQVAVKLPLDANANLEAIRQEAQLWLKASGHPNIVPVIEAEVYDGQVVIASEYIAGGSLYDWMQGNESYTLEETVAIANGILAGLDYLHRAGLTHRDLKPENVLLQDGIPRLTDFGLARVLKSVGNTSTISGTPRYMAPETFAGDYSAASDLWSVGVLLQELLTSEHPFPTTDLMALIGAIQGREPGPLPDTVPARLRAIVGRLLAKDPSNRYASASAVREALLKSLQPVAVPAAVTDGLPPNNLPAQTSSFVGREQEIDDLGGLMSDHRLVTLTGSGGCGKTRLSLEVAAGLLHQFPDGVWFVELASLSDPGLVPQTVAMALGIREAPGEPIATTLVSVLKAKRMLLVLDNCEHLLESSARLVYTVLRSCPNVRFLISSRESLGIAGERAFRVPSLSLPDPQESASPGELIQYEALRLFVDRASAVKSEFLVTEQNAAALVSICRRLDGIPLAIELAAARIRSLTAEELEKRLGDRFRVLTGGSRTALPRQQTLRAMIDWSYDLLEEKQKTLLRRLSVFAGGWTLDAAEAVCADEGIQVFGHSGIQTNAAVNPNTRTLERLNTWEILDLLTALADKSLILAEARDGVTRYRLLETVRQYARDRLAESGEGGESRNRHLNYFLALAEEAEPLLAGPNQAEWLNTLEAEHDNLRSALEWGMEAPDGVGRPSPLPLGGSVCSPVRALRLAGSLGRFWEVRGHLSEGRERLTDALAQDPDRRDRARGQALNGAGILAYRQGDYTAARALYDESLTLRRELGDKQGIASSLNNLGLLAWSQGDYVAARALYEESLTLRRELGDKWGIAASLNNLGNVANSQGDYAAARTLYDQSLTLRRELGDKWGIAASLNNLGNVAYSQGDYAAARTLYDQSLTLRRELGDKWGIAASLNNLGNVAYSQGDYAAARTLYDQSLTLRRELGDKQGIASSLNNLGNVSFLQGFYAAARTLYFQSLTIRRDLGDKLGIAASLEAFAELAAALSQSRRAAILLGAAEALRGQIGSPLPPEDREDHDRKAAAACSALGDEAFESAWDEGRAMTMEEAIDLALEGN